jgi:4-amino-4-deoxy-L-arabinose transferase-like glycosyltransferase
LSSWPSRITLKLPSAPRWTLPVAILALALVKGLVWTLALPPWYGPDEPSHFAYVQVLAVEGRVPHFAAPRDDGRDMPADIQCSEHNVGFRLNGPFFAEPPFGPDPSRCDQPDTPAAQRPEVPTSPSAGYSPLYYAAGVPFYDLLRDAPVETRLHAVRLLSVLLGVAAARFAYLAGFWAFDRRRILAAATAAVVTLQPMASQQFAIVNNDALLIAAGAAFFWRFFRALRRGMGLGDAAWMAALVGLAYLAKPQGAFLAPLVLIPLWLTRRRGHGWTSLLLRAGVFVAVLGGLVVLGIVGNLVLQGQAIPQVAQPVTGALGLRAYVHELISDRFTHLYWLLVVSAWGHFVWVSASLPPPTFTVISAVYLLAVAGVIRGALSRRPGVTLMVTALLSVLVVGTLLIGLEALLFRHSGTFILQGRSFLEILPAAAVIIVGGLVALLPRGCERAGAAAVTLAALALNIFSLMVLLETLFG